MNIVGWLAAVAVLASVLTAWMDPPSTGLVHAGALILATIWAGYSLAMRRNIPMDWLVVLPLTCGAWGVLQIALNWTVYPFETWNSASAWLTRAVIFSAAYAGLQQQNDIKRLQRIAIWFGGAYSLLALLQWYTGGGTVLWMAHTTYDSEVAGTFANRDHYAAFVELLLPVALAAAIDSERSFLVPSLCAGLMFASVIACGSRAGAFLVCMEALFFVIIAAFRRNYRAAALVVTSLILCTLVGGWTYVWQRFATVDLFASRLEMLNSTAAMIGQRPLTGFGLGTWPSVYPSFAVFDIPGIYVNHAHNDWAEWASDGGLLFAAVLAAFACASAIGARRHLWTVGILAVLAHALVDFPMHKPALACAVFFLAGVGRSASAVTAAKRAAEPRNCERQPQSLRPHPQS